MFRTLSLSLLLLLTACAGNGDVSEVTVADDDGVVEACGTEPGMTSCAAEVDEHSEEVSRDYTPEQADKAMEKEAQAVRHETPKQLDETITEMEQADGSEDVEGNQENDE